MKTRFLLSLAIAACSGFQLNAQSYGVGIGTLTPLNTLHISKGGGITAAPDGFTPPDTVALSGIGYRFFWAPQKLAFRAGQITAYHPTWWNRDSVGFGSFAFGGDLLIRGREQHLFWQCQ